MSAAKHLFIFPQTINSNNLQVIRFYYHLQNFFCVFSWVKLTPLNCFVFSVRYTCIIVSCQSINTDAALSTMWKCVPKPSTRTIRYLEMLIKYLFFALCHMIVNIIGTVIFSGVCWSWWFSFYDRDWDIYICIYLYIFVGCMSPWSWNTGTCRMFCTVLIHV